MNEIFIKHLKVNSVRHLKNLDISIADTERKHLIITGKNGSGKTSLLHAMLIILEVIQNSSLFRLPDIIKQRTHYIQEIADTEVRINKLTDEQRRARERNRIISLKNLLQNTENQIANLTQVELHIHNYEFLATEYEKGDFILAFFDAKRSTQLSTPNGIQKLQLKEIYKLQEKANQQFIQYLVNLKAQRSFARDAGKMDEVAAIDNWFVIFEEHLKEIFEDPQLTLEFDSENFDFNIIQSNKEKFNLNTLSDGYSAIMNIITELMMRMEKQSSKTYELQGIVLIDEIETHLHIELQKLILPFLTKVFPKIQFIVTTHSPFIINSLRNTSVYDLENRISVTDLSGFSVEGIIEAYFNADKYSIVLKNAVEEYERLLMKEKPSKEDTERIAKWRTYFRRLPMFMAPELDLKIKQLELSNL